MTAQALSTPMEWSTPFLSVPKDASKSDRRALIILNQPFSLGLLDKLWSSTSWRCCADGGANRLYDVLLKGSIDPNLFLPTIVVGDLDSIRADVRQYYEQKGVKVKQDPSQYSTDLMKSMEALINMETELSTGMSDLVILGGLAGRIDQTIHTMSFVHKQRKSNRRIFVVTDDNIAWLLDSGEHILHIDDAVLGPTCGLLPVGVDSTILSTRGLQWNLTDTESHFDGMVSSSNAIIEKDVWVHTTKPVWWSVVLKDAIEASFEARR